MLGTLKKDFKYKLIDNFFTKEELIILNNYVDIKHKDNTLTRFFGVITKMSEDMPTGRMHPKWAVSLQCSYCIELSSSGVMTSEKIALGGVVTDVSKYLLQS